MPHNTLQTKLNTECPMTKFDKRTMGKRFSKFLSKMFWHFNQAVPNYSTINRRSVDKHESKSIADKQIIYPARYRQRSSRQRLSTLMSIEEENEIELINCT